MCGLAVAREPEETTYCPKCGQGFAVWSTDDCLPQHESVGGPEEGKTCSYRGPGVKVKPRYEELFPKGPLEKWAW